MDAGAHHLARAARVCEVIDDAANGQGLARSYKIWNPDGLRVSQIKHWPAPKQGIGMYGDFPLGRWGSRYVQFCLVGGSGVLVDTTVIWLLASLGLLGWNLSLSKVIAAEVAIFNNFLWNDVWTFRGLADNHAEQSGRWRARLRRLAKFNLICAAGIALSVLLLNAQVHGLGMNVYLANFIAIVMVSLWNFWLNLRFGWNHGASCGAAPKESPVAR